MNVAVSIVVPVYNVEKYIDRCVHSLVNQTLKNIEIILVDDESPDECPQICDEYELKDGRIKVVHRKNGGLGLARNSGIEVAKGQYIAFIDSDDYVDESMFNDLYTTAIENNSDAVITGGFTTELSNGTSFKSQDIKVKEDIIGNENVKKIFLRMMGALPDYPKDYEIEMSACKGIYRASLLREKNIRFKSERELISEDLIFHKDFFEAADKVTLLPDIYYHYCVNPVSLTQVYREDRFLCNVKLYNYLIDVYDSSEYGKEYKLYADRMLLARARVSVSQAVEAKEKWSRKKANIVNIVSNDTLLKILHGYPVSQLPTKQRIFVDFMKHKNIMAMYALTVLNNMKKK